MASLPRKNKAQKFHRFIVAFIIFYLICRFWNVFYSNYKSDIYFEQCANPNTKPSVIKEKES